jgi:transcriptional regulator with XRE-family HTH domain
MTLAQGLGAAVRAARLGIGISQEELAARCRMHPTALSKIERGEAVPRADTLRKLADVLGTTTTALYPPLRWDEERGEFVELS